MGDGSLFLASLRNADSAGKLSIVGRNVKVRHGVRVIDSGVVPKKETRKHDVTPQAGPKGLHNERAPA